MTTVGHKKLTLTKVRRISRVVILVLRPLIRRANMGKVKMLTSLVSTSSRTGRSLQGTNLMYLRDALKIFGTSDVITPEIMSSISRMEPFEIADETMRVVCSISTDGSRRPVTRAEMEASVGSHDLMYVPKMSLETFFACVEKQAEMPMIHGFHLVPPACRMKQSSKAGYVLVCKEPIAIKRPVDTCCLDECLPEGEELSSLRVTLLYRWVRLVSSGEFVAPHIKMCCRNGWMVRMDPNRGLHVSRCREESWDNEADEIYLGAIKRLL